MDMFVIQGGKPLNGTVAVGGAKNSALPLMAAALAADGETILRGVPRLVDVDTLSALLETLGVRVTRGDQNELSLALWMRGRISPITNWFGGCGPVFVSWDRCSPEGAKPAFRSPAGATSAIGRSTCT